MYNYVHIHVVIGGKIPVGNFLTIIKLGNNVLQCIAHEFLVVLTSPFTWCIYTYTSWTFPGVYTLLPAVILWSHPVWKEERSMQGSDDGQW